MIISFSTGFAASSFPYSQIKNSDSDVAWQEQATAHVENLSETFIETTQSLPIACEKPSFSFRLYTAFRLLITPVACKENFFKQFFKNKLFVSEVVSATYFGKRLYAGYYTYGLCKIRF